MNRTPDKATTALLRQPARLVAGALGTALVLLGAVPMTGRFLAHLEVWTLVAPVPGLPYLLLIAAGALVLFLTLRRGNGTSSEPNRQDG